MKTIWMILLGALVSGGCYGNPANPEPGVSEIATASVSSTAISVGLVTLRFDEVVTHGVLELRLLNVMDSRCPTGVTCVWAGEVKVALEASDAEAEDDQPVGFELTLPVRGVAKTASVLGYDMQLMDVNPYPGDGITPKRSDYLAEVKISQAAQKP